MGYYGFIVIAKNEESRRLCYILWVCLLILRSERETWQSFVELLNSLEFIITLVFSAGGMRKGTKLPSATILIIQLLGEVILECIVN